MQQTQHRFPYNWILKDAVFTKDKGKVFSCFSCGGGSTMGYKLAGFDVIGCNEIDPKMMKSYISNHNPKYSFLEPIQDFKSKVEFPNELYSLDILDGSPPCSSFSMAGSRDKDWGKEKKFREGQSKQVLDTLFFDFIELAERLQPKIVVAENVKGLLLGNAKDYVRRIYESFDAAGYYCQHWLLDSSKMGVPQKRERVFFIALRKDLSNPFLYQKDMFTSVPKLNIDFNEPEIPFSKIYDGLGRELSEFKRRLWEARIYGDQDMSDCRLRVDNVELNFGCKFLYKEDVVKTLTSKGVDDKVLFDEPIHMSTTEMQKACSFPLDYKTESNLEYLMGMSVPPVMTAQIATEIYNQWLSKI